MQQNTTLYKPQTINPRNNININKITTQKNISDEDVFATTGTGSDLEKNINKKNRNLFKTNKILHRSSKNLLNINNLIINNKSIIEKNNSSKDLSKSYYSKNPKNNSTFDYANFSEQNDSENKNYDYDTDIDSDDCLNISVQLLEDNHIYSHPT